MSAQRSNQSWITLSSLCLIVGACDPDTVSEAELEADLPASPELDELGTDLEGALLERYRQRILDSPPTEMKGVVTALDGAPIAGVKVTIGDHEGLTDAAGEYNIRGVMVGSYVVSFAHADHVFVQRRLTIEHPEPAWLPQRLLPRSRPQRIDADALAVVREGPLTLEFEPGDLEFERDHRAVHGTVDIALTVIDPRVLGHLDAAPAELEGLTAEGQQVGLFSYGMLEVELSQDGKKVNIRGSETVKATMDVTAGLMLPAGESIPMWHHDIAAGIWAQERGVDATVQERGGVRLATAELPHFSAWNYDGYGNYGVCAPLVIPSVLNVGKARVTSTDQNGKEDGKWSVTADCAPMSGLSSRCAVNVPSGDWSQNEVYFKLQAQVQGSPTWCDMTLELNGATKGVFSRVDVNTFLATNGLTGGSWCGSKQPSSTTDLKGDQVVELSPENLPKNRVPFGTPISSLNCPATVGANAVAGSDKGFQAMALRAASQAYKSDFDADGVADKLDKCIANKNASQVDSDADGVGNTCETSCYIPPNTPNAKWFDADADGIDDYCDNKWSVYNPGQD